MYSFPIKGVCWSHKKAGGLYVEQTEEGWELLTKCRSVWVPINARHTKRSERTVPSWLFTLSTHSVIFFWPFADTLFCFWRVQRRETPPDVFELTWFRLLSSYLGFSSVWVFCTTDFRIHDCFLSSQSLSSLLDRWEHDSIQDFCCPWTALIRSLAEETWNTKAIKPPPAQWIWLRAKYNVNSLLDPGLVPREQESFQET